jgi:hypothetical protein
MIATDTPLLNNPSEWGAYIPAPTDFNRRQFERDLVRIAGKSPSGDPVLRLVWGWEATFLHRGERRLKYAFHTIQLPSGDYVDIGTPRWYIEELVLPAQYREEWERMRYTVDGINLIDDLGPPPPVMYLTCLPVARHEAGKACCERLWAESRRSCWGEYKAPGERELEVARYAVKERDRAHMDGRPDEPLKAEVLADCFKLQHEKRQRDDKRLKDKVTDVVDNFMRTFGGNFTSTDPSRHHHGRFKFLRGSSVSGATPEEIATFATTSGRKKIK